MDSKTINLANRVFRKNKAEDINEIAKDLVSAERLNQMRKAEHLKGLRLQREALELPLNKKQ